MDRFAANALRTLGIIATAVFVILGSPLAAVLIFIYTSLLPVLVFLLNHLHS